MSPKSSFTGVCWWPKTLAQCGDNMNPRHTCAAGDLMMRLSKWTAQRVCCLRQGIRSEVVVGAFCSIEQSGLIVLKNSNFCENRIFFHLRERSAFRAEGGGQFDRLRLLCRREASHGRSVLTFRFNGPPLKNHRFQISEFFNKIGSNLPCAATLAQMLTCMLSADLEDDL